MTEAGRSAAAVAGVIAVHLVVAGTWLGLDAGLKDGDELGVLGAVELFWGRSHEGGLLSALVASYVEDFGEFPALHYAVTGGLSALLGVGDLDGDGPLVVALLWSVLALVGTAWLAWEAAARKRGEAAVWAATLLATSPMWSGMQRHLLVENAATAWVALSAAAVIGAGRRDGPTQGENHGPSTSRPVQWVAGGLFAAAALLTKQTAVFALLPLGAVMLVGARRSGAPRWWLGPGLAATTAALIAGPWYLRRLAAEWQYLTDSAAANPDMVGPLHALAFYPLALLQQGWAPLVWMALIAVLWRRREHLPGALLAATVVGVVLLIGVPKKYPRLLVVLLPFLAAALGSGLAGWRGARPALGALLLGSLLTSSFLSPPLTHGLGPAELGLRGVDERCFQRWVEPPTRPSLPWPAIIEAVRAETGTTPRGGEVDEHTWPRLGAITWPSAPCAYQTSHDLGEHLRIRLRRSEVAVAVDAGSAFSQQDGWPEGPPDLLLTDGTVPCGEPPEAAGAGDPCALARWTEVTRFPYDHPDWNLDLRLWRRAP